MEVRITKLTSWQLVADLARATIGKGPLGCEPSMEFKRKALAAEHSPIRALMFRIDMIDIPYWVSVHLVRHKFGVEHFVSTQRTDRTGIDRTKKYQDAPVNHTMIVNAQEIMFMSRRRLCNKASPETQELWRTVVKELRKVDPVLASFCVPMCIYRGGCHEFQPCGKGRRFVK